MDVRNTLAQLSQETRLSLQPTLCSGKVLALILYQHKCCQLLHLNSDSLGKCNSRIFKEIFLWQKTLAFLHSDSDITKKWKLLKRKAAEWKQWQ